jgi:hypothetical protein
LFARPSFHVGASGLGFGLLSFVFTIGVLRWERQAIALAMIVSFLYGSMIWGIFPYDASVSWETHLSGALIGIVLAFALRWFDPPRPRKRYSWEDEEQDACAVDDTLDEPPQPRLGTRVHSHSAASLRAPPSPSTPGAPISSVSMVTRCIRRRSGQ